MSQLRCCCCCYSLPHFVLGSVGPLALRPPTYPQTGSCPIPGRVCRAPCLASVRHVVTKFPHCANPLVQPVYGQCTSVPLRMRCQPLYQMQSRGSLDDSAHLALLQFKGGLLEFLLHVTLAKEAPVEALVAARYRYLLSALTGHRPCAHCCSPTRLWPARRATWAPCRPRHQCPRTP
jgi:hypothetical protein